MSTIKVGEIDIVKECITHVSGLVNFTDSHNRIKGCGFSVYVLGGREIHYEKIEKGNLAHEDFNIAYDVKKRVDACVADVQQKRKQIIKMLNK